MKKINHITSKKFVIYAKKNLVPITMIKIYRKFRDHCLYTGKYRDAAYNVCNLKYKTPKEIPAIFHNGSNYDYHFIIKEVAEEFKGKFECLGEDAVKYITFSVKEDLDNDKTIT